MKLQVLLAIFFCFFSYSSFADINTVKLIFLHASSTLTAEYNE